MSFERNRGSLDNFDIDIFGSLDQLGIDNPGTLDQIGGITPSAEIEFILENNDFFELEDGLTFLLEDSV